LIFPYPRHIHATLIKKKKKDFVRLRVNKVVCAEGEWPDSVLSAKHLETVWQHFI